MCSGTRLCSRQYKLRPDDYIPAGMKRFPSDIHFTLRAGKPLRINSRLPTARRPALVSRACNYLLFLGTTLIRLITVHKWDLFRLSYLS